MTFRSIDFLNRRLIAIIGILVAGIIVMMMMINEGIDFHPLRLIQRSERSETSGQALEVGRTQCVLLLRWQSGRDRSEKHVVQGKERGRTCNG